MHELDHCTYAHAPISNTDNFLACSLNILTLKSPNRSRFCISVHSHINSIAISALSAVRIVLHMSDAGHVAVCNFPYMYMWYTHLYLTQAIEPNLVWDHFPLHAATTCIAWLLFKPEWMNLPTTISCSIYGVFMRHIVKGNLYNCDKVNASEITICHVKTDPVHVWWSYGWVEIFHICIQSVRKSCSEQS